MFTPRKRGNLLIFLYNLAFVTRIAVAAVKITKAKSFSFAFLDKAIRKLPLIAKTRKKENFQPL